jgi:hypothetical protein
MLPPKCNSSNLQEANSNAEPTAAAQRDVNLLL